MLEQAVFELAASAAVVILSVIAKLAFDEVKNYLRRKELWDEVETIVRYVEQTAEAMGYDSARKKEIAVLMLKKVAEKLGLALDEQDIDKLIEAAVQIIHSGTAILPA